MKRTKDLFLEVREKQQIKEQTKLNESEWNKLNNSTRSSKKYIAENHTLVSPL